MPAAGETPRVKADPRATDAALSRKTGGVTPILTEAIRHRPLMYEAGPTTIPILRFGGELPVSLTYSVQQRTTWGFAQQPAEITLCAAIVGTDIEISTFYTVPCDFKVRDELQTVEQTLYDLIGDVIRAEEQRRRATAAASTVSTLEELTAQPCMRDPYAQAGLLQQHDAKSVSPDIIREFITAVISETRVTSLNYDDFIESQAIAVKQIGQPVEESGNTSASLLNNLVGLMAQQIRPKMPARNLQLIVLDHLQRVNDSNKLIGGADAEQIIERLVPAFMKYHKAKRRLPKLPDGIFGHAVSSAVSGYLLAWLASKTLGTATVSHLSTFVQVCVNRAFATHLQLSAFAVAWAVSGIIICCSSYLQFPFAYMRACRKIARLKSDMLANLHLTLQPSDRNGADLARYAEAFRSKSDLDDSK